MFGLKGYRSTAVLVICVDNVSILGISFLKRIEISFLVEAIFFSSLLKRPETKATPHKVCLWQVQIRK